MNESFELVIKHLREHGFTVEIIEGKHYKLRISFGEVKIQQIVVPKTPGSTQSVEKNIARIRTELRKKGFRTLDNFTARLMTEYELDRILDAAAEAAKNAIEAKDITEANDLFEVMGKIAEFDDSYFETDPMVIEANNSWLAKELQSK